MKFLISTLTIQIRRQSKDRKINKRNQNRNLELNLILQTSLQISIDDSTPCECSRPSVLQNGSSFPLCPLGRTISDKKSRTSILPILLFLLKRIKIAKFVSLFFFSLLSLSVRLAPHEHRCYLLRLVNVWSASI